MLRASERGSTAVAVALSSPRTMMMMRCQSSKSNSSDSLPRPRQRRRRPSDVSARATPPPVVRGAGGGGGGGGSDEEGRAEQQRRHSWAPPGAPPSRRSDGESLQARVAADVLGVVHPARRNLTFSKALDALTASALEAYCCGWTERDLDRELARAHARERDAPKPAVAASYVLLVWLTAEAAADVLGGGDARSSLGISRWSRAPAVSEASRRRWAGFAKLIVDAYYKKSWAWYPIEALALEMSAAAPAVQPRGRRRQESPNEAASDAADDADESDSAFPPSPSSDDLIFASSPADVAEWARVVYATLDLLGRRGEGKRRF